VGVSEGIFSRKVRQEVAKSAEGQLSIYETLACLIPHPVLCCYLKW